MIRSIVTTIFSFVLSLVFIVTAYANNINVIVNGSPVDFPDAKPYINEDNRTMVPIRFISEKLGGEVKWDSATSTAVVTYKNNIVAIPIGQKYILINGQKKEIDTEAIIKDTRITVPPRFIAEALGAKVVFSSVTSTVRITTSDVDLTSTYGRYNKYKTAPSMMINKNINYVAEVKTNRGNFKIKLLTDKAPLTVNNFVFLAKEGFYNGISFHRIIKDFMIQTGDPLGNGTGGPGYKFNDELPPALPYGPGIVAMANSGPNTNGSQFFICNGDNSKGLNNNPNYTVFGQIVEGMDIIQNISNTPVENNERGERSKPMEHIYIEKITILQQ